LEAVDAASTLATGLQAYADYYPLLRDKAENAYFKAKTVAASNDSPQGQALRALLPATEQAILSGNKAELMRLVVELRRIRAD
jgi:hypothetical protein